MIDLSLFTTDLLKSLNYFKPETSLIVTFLVAMIADLIFRKSKNISAYIAIAGLLVTGFFLYQQTGVNYKGFQDLIVVDSFSQFMKFIILISTFFVILFSFFSNEINKEHSTLGEYYTLIIGMAFGMFLLVSSANLILIYLAIETISISSYILVGYTKEVKRASEASLKYVIFGAVSSGIMIYGMSLLFGLTGSLNLFEINSFLIANKVSNAVLLVSGLMIISGFGYKISAVPFHFWTPDVYEGAPVTITAYLSVASKAAGFAVLLRFFASGLVSFDSIGAGTALTLGNIDWQSILAGLAILTMTLGNLVAIWQKNLKRMLAYSSIAHAGYLLMAVAVLNVEGTISILIYFFVYMLMNLGAFFIVQLIANKTESEEISDYNGLGYRSPIIAACFTIFLISLTGLPPTAGFIGKLYVFSAVLNSGFLWLALIGVLNSVVSLFYYVNVIRNMYLREGDKPDQKIIFSTFEIALVLILAAATLIFGIYFTPIVDWATYSMNIFIG